MAEEISLYNWLRLDHVLGYIVNAYEGIKPVPNKPSVMRRVFLWEEEGEVKMGNAEAFVLHLGRHFERRIAPIDASSLHELLRDLGDVINPHKSHNKPSPDGPYAGHFKQPDPDEWVIRQHPGE